MTGESKLYKLTPTMDFYLFMFITKYNKYTINYYYTKNINKYYLLVFFET